MHFRIQMYKGTAIDALRRGLEDLEEVCTITLDRFTTELENFNSNSS
nr:unnamed protein product [Callosobruchus chinensis]